MKKTEPSKANPPTGNQMWGLWFLAIVPWALQLFSSYGLLEWYCENPDSISGSSVRSLMYVITFVCVSIVLLALILSLRLRRQLPPFKTTTLSRAKFMANGGILLSSFLTVTILVQGWPALIIPLCGPGSAT